MLSTPSLKGILPVTFLKSNVWKIVVHRSSYHHLLILSHSSVGIRLKYQSTDIGEAACYKNQYYKSFLYAYIDKSVIGASIEVIKKLISKSALSIALKGKFLCLHKVTPRHYTKVYNSSLITRCFYKDFLTIIQVMTEPSLLV